MLKLQIQIMNFYLTFALTGVPFWDELNYVGHVGKQEIKFG